jgi:hypothetical protein
MPGAIKLLQNLKSHNIPIALATSSSAESFALKTKHLTETFNLFHHKVFGGSDPEVRQGKPNPDIFLVAAERFPDSPDPSKVLLPKIISFSGFFHFLLEILLLIFFSVLFLRMLQMVYKLVLVQECRQSWYLTVIYQYIIQKWPLWYSKV